MFGFIGAVKVPCNELTLQIFEYKIQTENKAADLVQQSLKGPCPTTMAIDPLITYHIIPLHNACHAYLNGNLKAFPCVPCFMRGLWLRSKPENKAADLVQQSLKGPCPMTMAIDPLINTILYPCIMHMSRAFKLGRI